MPKAGKIFQFARSQLFRVFRPVLHSARRPSKPFSSIPIHESSYLMPTSRPKHLDLMQIRMPLPAFVSILHRVSGALLFLMLPILLCLWGSSLESPQSFSQVKSWIAHPLAKLVLLGLLWAYLHHFCAGIRHLAMDLHKGLELQTARATSCAVLGVSIVLTLVIGVKLW
jgi:succinate dehydrogenase / fumarate reductase, cytochrome b subunit